MRYLPIMSQCVIFLFIYMNTNVLCVHLSNCKKEYDTLRHVIFIFVCIVCLSVFFVFFLLKLVSLRTHVSMHVSHPLYQINVKKRELARRPESRWRSPIHNKTSNINIIASTPMSSGGVAGGHIALLVRAVDTERAEDSGSIPLVPAYWIER